MNKKKRRKITDTETLSYYRNLLLKRYLEDEELSEELIDHAVNHPSKWLRNVSRHYVQYLYY